MTMRVLGRAALMGVAVAAVWTAVAFAVPAVTKGDALALAMIAGSGIVILAFPPLGAARRRPLVLTAAATTALLIFLVISWLLPAFDGFVRNWDPPTYTDVTRLNDPVGELGIFVLLALALGADTLWSWVRSRRVARRQADDYGSRANEMVVLPSDVP
jgi:hypothetical protein